MTAKDLWTLHLTRYVEDKIRLYQFCFEPGFCHSEASECPIYDQCQKIYQKVCRQTQPDDLLYISRHSHPDFLSAVSQALRDKRLAVLEQDMIGD